MANRAVCREPCLGVIRIRRPLVILHVARRAVLRNAGVVVVYVTTAAGHVDMCPRQRESRKGAMVEIHLHPGRRVVARLTRGRERQLHVAGIGRCHVILHVAAHAIRGSSFVLASDMALGAFQVGVRPNQCKSREFQVIKFRAQPRVHVAVALLALRGKAQCHVARAGGLLEILQVTTDTIRRESQELPHRCALVAIVALQCGVRANEGEPVLMILDLADPYPPPLHRMALLARRTELPPVNVSVAVGAFHAHIRKNQIAMALPARNLLVHAAQRILRLVVIKFRDVADRLPTRKRVAVLTRDGEISVRTARRHIRPGMLRSQTWGRARRCRLSGLRRWGSKYCRPHDDVEDQGREHGVQLRLSD